MSDIRKNMDKLNKGMDISNLTNRIGDDYKYAQNSDLGIIIADDFKEIILIAHFFIENFFSMIGLILSSIANLFIWNLKNIKTFMGFMLVALLIILFIVNKKPAALLMWTIILIMLVMLSILGVVCLVIYAIIDRIKIINLQVERFKQKADDEYMEMARLIFNIIGNTIAVILLFIVLVIILFLTGLIQKGLTLIHKLDPFITVFPSGEGIMSRMGEYIGKTGEYIGKTGEYIDKMGVNGKEYLSGMFTSNSDSNKSDCSL